MRSRWLSIFVVLALTAVGLTANVAFAQTTGMIEGVVTDSNSAPLPGASVEIRSPSLQGTRTVVSDVAGRFRFPQVPSGAYTVTAALSGFKKIERTNVVVSLGGTATVYFKLEISITQEVIVTGEAPVVDVATTTTGTTYTSKVISQLPVGRNYADIVRSQPGVQTDTGETQGRSLALSIYGSTSAENLYLIDGVNTTNVIKGFQGKAINNEFVEEVEVKTGGYQAEFGRNTGGVVNVITKSGGNEFHGEVFGYYDNTSMKAQGRVDATPAYSRDGDVQGQPYYSKNNRQEYGLGFGGYFWKDRIWFYGAYDRVDQKIETFQTAGVNVGSAFPRDVKSDLYSGKLTFRITDSTTLIGSVFADPQTNEGALADLVSGTNPNTYNGKRDLGGTDYAAKLSQVFGTSVILNAQYARHSESFLTTPQGTDVPRIDDLTPGLQGRPTFVGGGYGSVFGPTINNESKRDSVGGALSFFFGSHEIKAGGDWQSDTTTGATYYTGAQRLIIRPCTQSGTSRCDLSQAPVVPIQGGGGATTPVFYEHRFYNLSNGSTDILVTSPFNVPSKFWSGFIQDTFKILPNLTVNLGVRYDDQKTYKGNGDLAFHLDQQWAPRVGFAWDPMKDGSTKVYGSWGKFYWPTPTDLNVRVFTANSQQTMFNYSSSNVAQFSPGRICSATITTNCSPRNATWQGASFEGEPVEEGLKGSYQHELTFGVERALDPTFSLGLKFTYRSLGEGVIEDRCDLDPDGNPLGASCAITNAGASSPIANGAYTSCNGSGNPTDPTAGECGLKGQPMVGAKRNYWGIELVAKKRVTNSLYLQASYLYSQLRGNYSGAIRVASGQTDPGINADYDYYQFAQQADGKLELDRPHQFRVDAVYQAPFGLNVGVQAWARSGQPTNRLGWFNGFYPDLLYLDPRGSGDRLPWEYDGNLSVAYDLKIGGVTITPQIYVYNFLNRQTSNSTDQRFNPNGFFVTNPASPYYGQAGVEPGTRGPDGTLCTSSTPCTDNIDYGKTNGRVSPRSLRVAVKVAF